jgi:hypothetical protein
LHTHPLRLFVGGEEFFARDRFRFQPIVDLTRSLGAQE